MEDLVKYLLIQLLRTIHSEQNYHPPSQIRKVFLSSNAILQIYDQSGLIETKTGCTQDKANERTTVQAKQSATLSFGQFRKSIDEYFENKTIRMESKDLLAVSIMYHLARWIEMADYEVCIEMDDALFLMYGLAGPNGNRINEIKLKKEDIRNV